MILALVLAALSHDPQPAIVAGMAADDPGLAVVIWPAYVVDGRVQLWSSAVESLTGLTECPNLPAAWRRTTRASPALKSSAA